MTLENLIRVTVLFICISLYLVIKLKESKDELKKEVEFSREIEKKEVPLDAVLLLASVIHSECDKCSEEEMYLVGSTVLNRVESPLFPNDLWSVVFSFRQFHGTNNKRMFRTSVKTEMVAEELLTSSRFRNREVLYFSGVNTLDVVPRDRIVKMMQFHKFYK